MDFALTLLALVFGTLGFLAVAMLLRELAERGRAEQHDDVKASGRRSAHADSDDTVLNTTTR